MLIPILTHRKGRENTVRGLRSRFRRLAWRGVCREPYSGGIALDEVGIR